MGQAQVLKASVGHHSPINLLFTINVEKNSVFAMLDV